jgi:inosose dehydratase
MTIRFGVSPIAWVNDDMPELGAGTALETILADARDIGFEGVELGGIFPRDPAVLKPLMAGYGLDLVGGGSRGTCCSTTARPRSRRRLTTWRCSRLWARRLFVHAETSNAIHGQMGRRWLRRRVWTPPDWRQFGARLTRFADYIAGEGLRFAYHHHWARWWSGRGSRRLPAAPPARWWALPWTPATRRWAASIRSGRSARIRNALPMCTARNPPRGLRRVQARGDSFLKGVLAGMFTVPGDGSLDYGQVMRRWRTSAIPAGSWWRPTGPRDRRPKTYGELGLRTLEREAPAPA